MKTTVAENNEGNMLQPGVSQNMKINKFMEDLSRNSNKRDIVLLLISIAEKPEIATDFNISLSYYLSLFLRTNDELNLSDAGILILNSTKIYARRVDYVHDDIVKMAIGLKADAQPQQEKRVLNKVSKKIAQKRSLLEDGNLIEIEMSSNTFKKSTRDKCFVNENETSLACFDAPKNYFSAYKKYQEYHIFNKKRKKNTNNLTSDFVNPNLWKNSKIFDFDYEDEIDTKRNYRIFKHHIEHRYKTLVNDINFIMYFKVKDFVEEKEEELRNQTEDTMLENYWNAKDYITIENEVLEKETKPCEIYFTQSRDNSNKKKINRLGNILCDPLNKNYVNKDSEYDSGNFTDFSSENFNSSNAICLPDISSINQTTDAISFNNVNSNNDRIVPDVNANETSLIEGNNEVFDKNKIIVRLNDDDEGVCFANLDDTEKMMLSPRIVTTDIAKYMNDTDISNLTLTVDDNIGKMFGIDEFCPAPEDLLFPDVLLAKLFHFDKFHIEKNIFKFPDKVLQKKRNFRLTEEFKLFKQARKYKRQNGDENCPVPLKSMRLQYIDPVEPFDEAFCGFSVEEIYRDMECRPRVATMDKNRSTSLDSGMHCEDDMETIPNGTIDDIRTTNQIGNDISGVEIISNELIINGSFLNNSTIPNELSNIENDFLINDNLSITDVEKNIDTGIEMDSNTETVININEDNAFISNIDMSLNVESHEETNKMIQKIQNWHRHLKPMLAKSKERHHFDIFDLGTEIMDKFSNESNLVTFSDVMHNKDPSFTSRYFLSVLLLANSNNIEINPENRTIFNPTDPDKITIKLKNRKRHIVSEVDNIGLASQKRSHAGTTQEQDQSVIFSQPPKRSKKSINADNDSGYTTLNLTSSENSFS